MNFKSIEEIVPQYLFGLGGSFKLKRLVEYIEGAVGRLAQIEKQLTNSEGYKIG